MRIKHNSDRKQETLIMHDKALDLGFTTLQPPPNWMTEGKTPNWNRLLYFIPDWMTEQDVLDALGATIELLKNDFPVEISRLSDWFFTENQNYIYRISRLYVFLNWYRINGWVKFDDAFSDELCYQLDIRSPWRLRP